MSARVGIIWAALALAGCRAVDVTPSDEDPPIGTVRVHEPAQSDAGVDASIAASVSIDEPAEGSVFVRDVLEAGEWIAAVTFAVSAAGVARVELWADGEFLLGEVAGGTFTYGFYADGERSIEAIGYDASGAELARDGVHVVIEPPLDESCHAALDALGIEWTVGAATQGIADPVRVQPLINGVTFHYLTNEPTAMLMDCDLAPRLHALAAILARYGIDEVSHLGIYNYRCIGGGDPDSGTCTPSQHAYARAIDLHAFGAAGSDAVYNTETDWIITSGESCPFTTFSEEDRILKEIACALWAEGTFQIVLTPNYNDAHRNHFHVDLTEGSMFIGQSAAGVDPGISGLGH